MLAADGRCKTLDASADGYVRGEAIGALLLRAVQQGSSAASALALFCGSAVNQDGRSSSLTAPNGPSQQEVMRAGMAFAGLSAADASHLQMHGTGTPLGDPIEMGAAAAVLVDGSRRAAPLAASTAKAWIGHTEAAAGAMGMTHTSVALSHRLTHGIMHLSVVNSHVAAILDMAAAKSAAPGWHLPRQTSAAIGASSSGASVAGISSFAFQGTNAHALLQQAGGAAAAPVAVELAIWSKQRMWVAPPAHILLQTAATSGSGAGRLARRQASAAVALEAALAAPQLAFLWQHSVLGMAMFPATAFVEMAAGASRQLANASELSTSAIRSAVFATPLALPAAGAAGLAHVRCLVQAGAGSFEVGSAGGSAGQVRTHFYASLSAVRPTAGSTLPGTSSADRSQLACLLLSGFTAAAAAPARVATAEVAVPQEQLGMSVHPAVSEAAMHVVAAHQRQHRVLRVAARIESVHVPQPLPDSQVWASNLVSASGSRQEQRLLGSAGTAMQMAGMETRRLVAQVGFV